MKESGSYGESGYSTDDSTELDTSNEAIMRQHNPFIEGIKEELLNVYMGHLPKPEEALERVVQAAEKNLAIERVIERSHEIKDDSSNFQPVLTQESSRIGELLQEKRQNYKARAASHIDLLKGVTGRTSAANNLYIQAVRYGFVSALLALLTAVAIVTLFT